MAGWYAGLLVLIALTLGLYEFVPRYEPSDRQVLGNLDGGDLAGWWTMGSVRRDPQRSRSVVLEVAGAAAGASVLRRTVDLRTPATVILRAKIAADILELGEGSGGGAWMIIGNLAGSGPDVAVLGKGAYQPYLATSSHGWRSLEATSTVPAGRGRSGVRGRDRGRRGKRAAYRRPRLARLALSELVLRLYWRSTGCDRVR